MNINIDNSINDIDDIMNLLERRCELQTALVHNRKAADGSSCPRLIKFVEIMRTVMASVLSVLVLISMLPLYDSWCVSLYIAIVAIALLALQSLAMVINTNEINAISMLSTACVSLAFIFNSFFNIQSIVLLLISQFAAGAVLSFVIIPIMSALFSLATSDSNVSFCRATVYNPEVNDNRCTHFKLIKFVEIMRTVMASVLSVLVLISMLPFVGSLWCASLYIAIVAIALLVLQSVAMVTNIIATKKSISLTVIGMIFTTLVSLAFILNSFFNIQSIVLLSISQVAVGMVTIFVIGPVIFELWKQRSNLKNFLQEWLRLGDLSLGWGTT